MPKIVENRTVVLLEERDRVKSSIFQHVFILFSLLDFYFEERGIRELEEQPFSRGFETTTYVYCNTYLDNRRMSQINTILLSP